jgi:hypothetical protein
MTSRYAIDTENLQLTTADCVAIQTSLDADPHTAIDRAECQFDKADMTNLKAALNSDVLGVDGPNLFIQLPEMARVKLQLTG